MSSLTVDVIVVGGGIIGMTTALLLADADFSLQVAIIETNCPRPVWQQCIRGAWDVRTSAVTRFTERVWASLGVWDTMRQKRVSAYHEMAVYDGTGWGELHFSAAEIGELNLGHIVENEVILSSLWTAVLDNPAIKVMAPVQPIGIEYGTDGNIMVMDNQGGCVSASLLIGADGPHSWVRDRMKIPCDKVSYNQAAVITTVRTACAHGGVAWQRFLPTGPLAFLPLADPHVSSVVWTQPLDGASNWCQQSIDQQKATLTQASDYHFGEMAVLNEPLFFPLYKQHAQQYVKPSLVLLGDAAHVMHPLAGQGVHLGIQDASILVKILQRTRGVSRQSLGHYWNLRCYERQRRAAVTEMLGLVGGLNALFGSSSSLVRSLRGFGLQHINRNHWVKGWLMQQALGV